MNWVVLYSLIKKLTIKVDSLEDLTPFSYKGSVETKADLPVNATKGAMYTVKSENNAEYVWSGSEWISIGEDTTTLRNDVRELKSDLTDKVPKKDYAPETKTESMTQPVGKDENGKLWTTPGSGGSGGAVSSVNGKTGAVVLTAGDVHALPDNTIIPTIPEKVSAFENDAGYLTEHQDISGKVDKVDGKGLSSNDYDNTAKAKVDAIPEDPKYTDTVYDDTEVRQGLNHIKGDLAEKLTKPKTTEVGKYFRIASIDEAGNPVLEAVDLPKATATTMGISRCSTYRGTQIAQDGANAIIGLSNAGSGFAKRTSYNSSGDYAPVTTENFDYAVRLALTDGRGVAWTDAERIAALLRMGCTVDDNGFVKWTAQEVVN